MTTVFQLYHEYSKGNGETEYKAIGIYSSAERAHQAIERLKSEPGFREYPKGFRVDEIELDRDSWREGFVTIDP